MSLESDVNSVSANKDAVGGSKYMRSLIYFRISSGTLDRKLIFLLRRTLSSSSIETSQVFGFRHSSLFIIGVRTRLDLLHEYLDGVPVGDRG
ncbi:hypothetical protein [Nostoc sp. ChiSLP03a]|uniref:hypothetical protein n=1 Tax=Nostoc sp. ChiSLP03a TaxID=3075380 RepID=UPI00391BC456